MMKQIGEYNYKLCEERHKNIEGDMDELKRGLLKVNNRFIVFLTMLSLNLLGVVCTLVVMWLNSGGN
jgi:hypothetical protein